MDAVGTEHGRRRAPAMSSEERRTEILRAALPLLTEHGANITTRQIAQAAGIAEGTVFRVFTDKEELLRACVTEAFRTDEVCARIRQVSVEQDIDARLIEAGLLFAEHFARVGELLRTLATTGYDVHQHGPKAEKHHGPAEFMRGLADSLGSLLNQDDLRMPLDDLARMYLGLLVSSRFDPKAEQDMRASIAQRVDLLLHGALRN
jgi:AcrR family transcriptional regulator